MGFAYAEENKDKVKELASRKDGKALRRADRTRPSPTATLPAVAEPVHLRQQREGDDEPGRRRYVDYYLADGTTRRSSRRSPTSTSRPMSSRRRATAWERSESSTSSSANGRPARWSGHRGSLARSLSAEEQSPSTDGTTAMSLPPREPRAATRAMIGASCSRAAIVSIADQRRHRPVARLRGGRFLSQIDVSQLFAAGWFPRRGMFDLATLLVGRSIMTA